jgi:hypothetical protein
VHAGTDGVGSVVMAAQSPSGGIDQLFEAPTAQMDAALHLGGPDGAPIVVQALPYDLRDVTA